MHVHERRLFLISGYCTVMCVTCGMESIPWEPTRKALADALPFHEIDATEYMRIRDELKKAGRLL